MTREKTVKNLVCFSLLAAASVSAAYACDTPAAPSNLPDGKSATMEQMMSAKKGVDQFRKDMESYRGCVKDQAKADSAQAELEKVAGRFNAEVRAYKAANSGK